MLTATYISCLVIPDGCNCLPALADLEQGIPVIAVRENKNSMQNKLEDLPFSSGKLFVVENYLEAVGVINAIKAGVAPEAVRRPIRNTAVSDYMERESQVFKMTEYNKLNRELSKQKQRKIN